MSVVLDASALLAYLQSEPGGERVREVLARSVMSSVNWSEVIGKARDDGVDTRGLREDLASLGLAIEPFSAEQAEIAGRIRERTRAFGLSLGDRACLALGSDRGEAVYTADRAWLQPALGIEVEAIR
ncbi:MAG: type II toxin-antitoxin system VapC family toxin [Thiotrichales bacterium]|nr:type II toxin-antitoxin system VapC family toxin [Thiotrichales bacterium]